LTKRGRIRTLASGIVILSYQPAANGADGARVS